MSTHPRVAIQGGLGSWSEVSLASFLPAAQVIHADAVDEAWRSVLDRRTEAAWLASHNSTTGDVAVTRTARAEGRRLDSLTFPVQHALLARPGVALRDVARVWAHPLALRQCRATLDVLVPRAVCVEAVDGAHAAARLVGRDAVLASASVAARRGLAVLIARAVDDPANATTFELLVMREAEA